MEGMDINKLSSDGKIIFLSTQIGLIQDSRMRHEQAMRERLEKLEGLTIKIDKQLTLQTDILQTLKESFAKQILDHNIEIKNLTAFKNQAEGGWKFLMGLSALSGLVGTVVGFVITTFFKTLGKQ